MNPLPMKYQIDPQILAACSKTVSSDPTRLVLQSVCVMFDAGRTAYVACDGHCLSYVEKKGANVLPAVPCEKLQPGVAPGGGQRFSVLFPACNCKDIARKAKLCRATALEIELSAAAPAVTVHFPSGETISFTQPEAVYPRFQQIIDPAESRDTSGRNWSELYITPEISEKVNDFFASLPGAERDRVNGIPCPVGQAHFYFHPSKKLLEILAKGGISVFCLAATARNLEDDAGKLEMFSAMDSARAFPLCPKL